MTPSSKPRLRASAIASVSHVSNGCEGGVGASCWLVSSSAAHRTNGSFTGIGSHETMVAVSGFGKAHLIGVCVMAASAIAAFAAVPSAVVEQWYSLPVYPAIQRVLTPVSNIVPIALLDVWIVLAAVGVVITIGRGVRHTRRSGRAAPVLDALFRVVVAGSVV